MAEQSTIEWTDATWNPVTGCTLVSEGCRHCYAATLAATRLRNHPSRKGLARINAAGEAKFTGEVRFNAQWLDQPLRWTRPRRIFVCAHGDLFHESVPDEWIDRVFAVMALAPQHTFQVLTKRPERARAYFDFDEGYGRWGFIEHEARRILDRLGKRQPQRKTLAHYGGRNLPHVWLGTSIEDQATADTRIPHLLATPAAVRFASAEPLLGPMDIRPWIGTSPYVGASTYGGKDGLRRCDLSGNTGLLHWVIVGGESGRNARPMHPDWARSLRDQCQSAGVAFFFKQHGEWLPFGQSGFTAWHAHTNTHGDLRKPKGKWWGHAYFNDGAGGPSTHAFGPVETMMIDNRGMQAVRIGKKSAGRLLDGREWSQMPGVSGDG